MIFYRTCRWATAMALLTVIGAPVELRAAQRTFVRSDGLDTSPCSVQQPCRSFAVALAKTAPGGEIVVLDSAGYGPVTIGQSVSIVAPPGVYAGVSVLSGNGIVIDGDATASVVLRGLSVNGLGGNVGIRLQQGALLHVEGCEVSNMQSDGISIESAGAEVFIDDTVVRDNAGNGVGLLAAASVVVDRMRSERNGVGIGAVDGDLAVRDSVVSKNGFRGIALDAFAVLGPSTLTVERTTIAGNGGDGIFASKGGTVNLVAARNTIAKNDRGVYVNAIGPVYAAITDNVVEGSAGIGLLASGAGAIMTMDGNTVTRSGAAGIAAQGGAVIRSRTTNTVMDNTPDLDPSTTLTPLGAL